jgi:(p)ppGpp synthase/HD superfamily hydrolase
MTIERVPHLTTRYMVALRTASVAHAGQSYGREPYIRHCVRVASRFSEPTMRCAAVLHDVLEDASWAFDRLSLAHAFGFEVERLVSLLTRPSGRSYEAYILGLRSEPDAARIKLADLNDHLTHNPPPSLRTRYIIARDILEEALADRLRRDTYLERPERIPSFAPEPE